MKKKGGPGKLKVISNRKKYCGIIETIEERDARGGFKDLPGFPED